MLVGSVSGPATPVLPYGRHIQHLTPTRATGRLIGNHDRLCEQMSMRQ